MVSVDCGKGVNRAYGNPNPEGRIDANTSGVEGEFGWDAKVLLLRCLFSGNTCAEGEPSSMREYEIALAPLN